MRGREGSEETFKEKKKTRGRKVGSNKTTKQEDKKLLEAFHKEPGGTRFDPPLAWSVLFHEKHCQISFFL